MRSSHESPHALRATPNVTPMIDVMLVLLIIFMTVGPLLADGFHAMPPRAANLTAHQPAETDAVIGIDAAGHLFYDRRPVTPTALRAALAERFARHPDDRVAYLRADASAPYRLVQDAMAMASDAGARVVGLVSAAPEPSRRVR